MSDLPFSIVDICFVAILVVSGILAYMRGFVREVLAVAAWVGATFATLYAYPHLQPLARENIANAMLADMTTGAVLFIVTLIALSALGQFVSRGVRDSAAGSFDRSLGFAFGVLRGAILVSLMYLSAAWFWGRDDLPAAVTEAKTFPLIEGGAEILLALVPEDAREAAEDATGMVKDKTDSALRAEEALKGLIQPKPDARRVIEGGPGSPGYGQSERSEMQRLIESKQ